ncbi:MAG: sigma-70 family RNA polymerase sigma factor [Oscillospiraceae bacterium]|nr:sigma-70 family RNA polymerase sigma factor [Oscillospiraceae bacterium]
MFDPKSDYSLNKKDPDAIVYPSATGVHIRLTRKDFASEEEFRFWKDFSDGDYKDTERAGRNYYDNCIPLNEALDSIGLSIEDVLLAPLLKAEQKEQRAVLLQQVKDALTETQYRRFWMYYVEKMNETEIALAEHVGQPRICRSLCRSREILKKSFLRGPGQGIKRADLMC